MSHPQHAALEAALDPGARKPKGHKVLKGAASGPPEVIARFDTAEEAAAFVRRKNGTQSPQGAGR